MGSDGISPRDDYAGNAAAREMKRAVAELHSKQKGRG